MKKEGIALVLAVFVILLSFLVVAQDDAKVEKAYDCLEDKVEGKCSSLTSVEDKAFVAMAIGQCVSELIDQGREEECWPSSSCRIRDTALSVLALRRNKKNTDAAEDWLIQQTHTPSDIIWFLEIDTSEAAQCTVRYNEREYDITLKDDKKISGSAGTCLSVDSSGYWLRIDSSCYDRNFTISCNEEFITTLLYRKSTGSTVYVSSKTNYAPAEGRTEERVSALCFGTGCDYEGSLWAVLALSETGHDISSYIPYLIAMADENERYFPSAFLYIITDYDDFFAEVIELQVNDHWKITGSPYHRFYDTALALLSLQGLDAVQVSAAKQYLLEVQEHNGCWSDSVRDTAFILYAGWPKQASSGGGAGDVDYCEDFKFYCVAPTECDNDDVKDLPCEGSLGKVCCTVPPKEETCAEKGGEICVGDEECDGKYTESSDSPGKCCVGNCEIPPEPEEPECEKKGYYCRSSCYDDEEVVDYSCDSSDVCCQYKEPSKSYWWIWLLVILIILVVLGIIFKDRLRAFIFNLKDKVRKGKGPAGPPGPPRRRFPPPSPQQVMARPRMMVPRQQTIQRPVRPAPKPVEKTDRELEETLNKLKKMSK